MTAIIIVSICICMLIALFIISYRQDKRVSSSKIALTAADRLSDQNAKIHETYFQCDNATYWLLHNLPSSNPENWKQIKL